MHRNEPVIRPRTEHNISRRDIDPDALKVLYRLARHGYTAYLVGGGVRDLLLGRRPKDFDVSTSAHPREIKKLFRNCFLIGRRFRLAHVKYGDKVIETSTFRRQPEQQTNPEDPEASLFQHEDNTFGTPEEDAVRRDFTVNGLFYDIDTFSVIDYVGGLADLEKRVIRCIGDPDIRFREDPIRMIRAVRFAARLGFVIEPSTRDAIVRQKEEIEKASPPRLLEEVYRLFAYESGLPAVRLLRETGLLQHILPEISAYLDEFEHETDAPMWRYLEALDRGDTVVPEPTPALIFAAMLHHPFMEEAGTNVHVGAIRGFLDPFMQRLRLPRRVADRLSRIFIAQDRLNGRRKRFSRSRFAHQDFFPEALALCEIARSAHGQDLTELQPWRDLFEDRVEEAEGIRSKTRDRNRITMRELASDEEGDEQDDVRNPGEDDTAQPRADREDDDEGDEGDASAESNGSDDGAGERKRRRRGRRGGRRRRRNKENAPAAAGSESAPTPSDADATERPDQGSPQREGSPAAAPQAAVSEGEDAASTQPKSEAGETATTGETTGGNGSAKKKSRRRRTKRPRGDDGDAAKASGGEPGTVQREERPSNETKQRTAEAITQAGAHDGDAPLRGGDFFLRSQSAAAKEKEAKPEATKPDQKATSGRHQRASESAPSSAREATPRPPEPDSRAPHWLDEI